MKKQFLLSLLSFIVVLGTPESATAPIALNSIPVEQKLLSDVDATYGAELLEDFLALSPKKIREQTGQKLSIKEVIVLKKAQNKIKKALKTPEEQQKSQIAALILVFFVGCLGVHRFYLGYTGIGVLQLLTGACCGIYWLIDLIRIATGDLKPKDGSDYKDAF